MDNVAFKVLGDIILSKARNVEHILKSHASGSFLNSPEGSDAVREIFEIKEIGFKMMSAVPVVEDSDGS